MPQLHDRWLWLGLAALFLASAYGIRRSIKEIVRLTELESRDINDEKQPDNSISPKTLETLYRSPNSKISAAATRLIVLRCVRDLDLMNVYNKDLFSPDKDLRRRAKQAQQLIKDVMDKLDGVECSTPSTDQSFLDAMDNYPDHARVESLEALTTQLNALVESSGDASAPFAGWDRIPAQRPVRNNDVEAQQRQRRREAMVLHEGEGQLDESNIIRPQR